MPGCKFSRSILHVLALDLLERVMILQLGWEPFMAGALGLVIITHRVQASFPVEIPLNTIILMIFQCGKLLVLLLLIVVVQVEISQALLVVVGPDRRLAIDLEEHVVAFEAH